MSRLYFFNTVKAFLNADKDNGLPILHESSLLRIFQLPN